MRQQFKTIDEYVAAFPKEVQTILKKIRKTIRNEAPDAVEAISYNIPTFKLDGKNLIHFAAYKHHIGMYPIPKGTKALEKELAPHIAGKGTLRFPMHHPIPYDLVQKIVGAHVKSRQEK